MASIAPPLLVLILCAFIVQARYEPTWESLDKRPLPKWYDEAKLGIFIHWGVFSVPSFGSEWFWWRWRKLHMRQYVNFMEKNYPPNFVYADFAPQFTAEFYDANEWARILKSSGAKYVVLTSKHHEGYTNWPSAVSFNWNSMDVGPNRDLVGELASAIKNNTDIHFGLYHSLFEWFNPLYLEDKESSFQTSNFVSKKTMPELYEIVNAYKPDIVWSDGQWQADSKYWNSTNFIAWLYNDSPVKDTVVTNDRWGTDVLCKHGGFLTCHDRYNPGVLQPRKWENAMTIDRHSWGYRRNAEFSDYFSIEELLQTFVKTISCGGNMLMNIGPTKEGTISPIFQERLAQMGNWLNVVGEAVYGTVPWGHQNDSLSKDVWYTAKGDTVYAFFFSWPIRGVLTLGSPNALSDDAKVTLLGTSLNLVWDSIPDQESGIFVYLNRIKPSEIPNQWVWVLKLEGFSKIY